MTQRDFGALYLLPCSESDYWGQRLGGEPWTVGAVRLTGYQPIYFLGHSTRRGSCDTRCARACAPLFPLFPLFPPAWSNYDSHSASAYSRCTGHREVCRLVPCSTQTLLSSCAAPADEQTIGSVRLDQETRSGLCDLRGTRRVASLRFTFWLVWRFGRVLDLSLRTGSRRSVAQRRISMPSSPRFLLVLDLQDTVFFFLLFPVSRHLL